MTKHNKTNYGSIIKLVSALAVLCILVVITLSMNMNKKKDAGDANSNVEEETKQVSKDLANNADTLMARSKITGKSVNKDVADSIPVAVMYSNIKEAMPQSCISEADVVFESLVEGGITRLCCLFENKTSLEKIGPVRSCRTYYLLFAKEFEATYVHFGYSDYASDYLAQESFHSLDGMVYCNFYRTNDRKAPHNAYTSWSGIMESAQAKGYPTKYPDGYESPFKFNEDDNKDIEIPNGQTCEAFYPGYPYNKPWFEYNEQTREYMRFQFDGPQVDAENGKQLSYKNILVKYVEPSYYDNGTPNYKIYGTGKGIFITDGKAIDVYWKKDKETSGPTKYFYNDGSQVVLNQGKTYICQIETSQGVAIADHK